MKSHEFDDLTFGNDGSPEKIADRLHSMIALRSGLSAVFSQPDKANNVQNMYLGD